MNELETMPGSDTIVAPDIGDPALDEGDHDRFAHFVDKNKLMSSAVNGHPVRALCGKLWVPNRDPKKFPVCPECEDIMKRLRDEGKG